MKKLNNKGFSLVELIIVIAIMAVLIAVLAPQFLRYVERSRYQKDASAIGELEHAAQVAASNETAIVGTTFPVAITIAANGAYTFGTTVGTPFSTEVNATIATTNAAGAPSLNFTSTTLTGAPGPYTISISANGVVTHATLPAAP